MADKSSLLLIPILTITVALSLLISNVNAIVVNNTDFSIDIPDNWAYDTEAIRLGVNLAPSEFGALLIDHLNP
jgi:hypothetical protein